MVSAPTLPTLDGGFLPRDVWQPDDLASVLRRAAKDGGGITFHEAGGFVSYADLQRDAERMLRGLRRRSTGRAVLRIVEPRHLLTALWSCLLGGIVPLLSASRMNLGEAGPVITDADVRESVVLEPDSEHASAGAGDLALLMLTSGSSGTPKVVRLTHGNVISSIAASAFVNRYERNDVSLNWLPLHHIGALMRSLRETYLGCHQVQVPTARVSSDPIKWLELIDHYRATLTWAPNTAFAGVVARGDELPEGIDLSCVRSLYSSGEPVVPRTVRAFADLLASRGLARNALHSAWGMTEACFATYSHAAADAVDSGRPVPGISLRINGGELEIRGPLVSPGYESGDEACTEDGWLRTGDLATFREGSLVITGRAKDMIKIGGIPFGSREIESAVEHITDALAVSVETDGAETMVLFVEDSARVHDIRAAVAAACGVAPRFVVPLDSRPVGETGKIDRGALRERFAAGAFDECRRWPFDLRMKPSPNGNAPAEQRALALRIAAVMTEVLHLEVEADANFFACGGNSLRVAQAVPRLAAVVGRCELTDLFHAPTPLALAARLLHARSSESMTAGARAGAMRAAARRQRVRR